MQNVKLLHWSLLLFTVMTGCTDTSEDVIEPLPFAPVKGQFEASSINVGSIVNVPSVRNAVLLASRQINEAGGVLGKDLNLIAFISNNTEDAVALTEDLLRFDVKMINVSYSSRSKAASALTIPKNIPLISESATSTFFTDYEDQDLYFRMVPSDVIQSQILANLAIEQGHETAVTVHNATDQYGETLIALFKQNFEMLGGTVLEQISVPFTVGQGFDTYLRQIQNVQPDVVLDVILEADESANFVNEAFSFGISSKFLFPDASAGIASFANNIANVENVKGALGTAPGFGLSTNPQLIFFEESYKKQYDVMPDAFDVNGYDFVMVTALAIEHAGLINNTDDPSGLMVRDSLRYVMNAPGTKVGPDNIAEALALIRAGVDVDYSGSYGNTEWDNNGDVKGELTFNILSIDETSKQWKTVSQQQVIIP